MLRQIREAQAVANDRWSICQSIRGPQFLIATFLPPEESVYHGGIFFADIKIPNDYPTRPPTVKMTTKIFHPNFSDCKNHVGNMYVEVLNSDYRSTFTLLNLMEYIYRLFINPDMDPLSQCNSKASNLYLKNYEQFKTIAKKWTNKYAI